MKTKGSVIFRTVTVHFQRSEVDNNYWRGKAKGLVPLMKLRAPSENSLLIKVSNTDFRINLFPFSKKKILASALKAG